MSIPRRLPVKRKRKLVVTEQVEPSESDMRLEEAQNKVISHMVAGHSQAAAAAAAGVHPTTVTRWKRDEEFRAAIERQTEQANKDSQVNRIKLRALGSKAIDILAGLMDSDNEKIRLSAATEVLDRTGFVKSKEVVMTGHMVKGDAPASVIEALEVLGMRAEDVYHALPNGDEHAIGSQNQSAHSGPEDSGQGVPPAGDTDSSGASGQV